MQMQEHANAAAHQVTCMVLLDATRSTSPEIALQENPTRNNFGVGEAVQGIADLVILNDKLVLSYRQTGRQSSLEDSPVDDRKSLLQPSGVEAGCAPVQQTMSKERLIEPSVRAGCLAQHETKASHQQLTQAISFLGALLL